MGAPLPFQIVELLPDQMAVMKWGNVSETVTVEAIDDSRIGDFVILHGSKTSMVSRRRRDRWPTFGWEFASPFSNKHHPQRKVPRYMTRRRATRTAQIRPHSVVGSVGAEKWQPRRSEAILDGAYASANAKRDEI